MSSQLCRDFGSCVKHCSDTHRISNPGYGGYVFDAKFIYATGASDILKEHEEIMQGAWTADHLMLQVNWDCVLRYNIGRLPRRAGD